MAPADAVTPHPPPPADRPAAGGRLRFDGCVLDMRRREFSAAGQVVPLQPRVYAMLCHLARHPGQVIGKQELLRAVWPTAHVTEAVLATAMLKLRKAIGDTRRDTPLVATVRGVGYRFDAAVTADHDADAAGGLPAGTSTASPAFSGRLALLQCLNATGDATLDWVVYGLPSLLHGQLAGAAQGRLVPLDSSLSWQARPPQAGSLERACAALGADSALSCTLRSAGDGHALHARWGASDTTAVTWQREASQVATLVEQLARALAAGAQAQPAPAAGKAGPGPGAQRPAGVASDSAFWEGQLARAMDLERRSMAEQALELLRSCLPHLPARADITRLHARLLRQRMALAEAHQVLDAALADVPQALPGTALAQLRVERALLLHLQRDIPGARQACDEAVAVIAQGLAPIDCLPEVLATAASIDFDRGDYRAAAQKAQRAMDVARSLNDKATVVASGIGYARAAYMDGQVQQSRESLQQTVMLAHDSGLETLEAEAYMRLAFQESTRWRHRAAADYARRASALASRAGDLANWHRAQVRELCCLIDMGSLDEAEALFERHFRQAAAWKAPIVLINQRTQRWILDWRQGRHDEAIAQMSEALAETPKVAADRLRRVSYRLMICLLCLDRRPQAEQVLALHRGLGYLTREVHLQAAFAIQQGDRPRAKHLLRSAWLTNPPDETEAWHVLESLAWLLLEDAETDGLEALMADVARLPREQASVPLVLYLHDVRRDATRFDLAHWATLVRANAGLLNRHAWLLDQAACQAWLRGDAPKLRVLLPDACI